MLDRVVILPTPEIFGVVRSQLLMILLIIQFALAFAAQIRLAEFILEIDETLRLSVIISRKHPKIRSLGRVVERVGSENFGNLRGIIRLEVGRGVMSAHISLVDRGRIARSSA